MASRLFSDDPYLFASGLAVGLVLNKVIPSRNLRLRTRLGLIFSCQNLSAFESQNLSKLLE